MAKGTVCVTGAGGFVGSWLVKQLLEQGYIVHGTVRDPSDESKNGHLKSFKNSENLKLFAADLQDYDSLFAAINGCEGLFHVASPLPEKFYGDIPDPEGTMIKPAIDGTIYALKAAKAAGVKRVIYISSGSAVFMNPDWPQDKLRDESCWSSIEYCKQQKHWYFISKILAEQEAKKYADESGLDVIRVVPMIILGPVLQAKTNTSTLLLLGMLKEGFEKMRHTLWLSFIDVRDLCDALLLLYNTPEANGRYICTGHNIKSDKFEELVRKVYPKYTFRYDGVQDEERMSSEKLRALGWKPRPLEETIEYAIDSYRKAGLLD